jgi:hypothetical protein
MFVKTICERGDKDCLLEFRQNIYDIPAVKLKVKKNKNKKKFEVICNKNHFGEKA